MDRTFLMFLTWIKHMYVHYISVVAAYYLGGSTDSDQSWS